jgi:phosphatidate cytidylyltransferase
MVALVGGALWLGGWWFKAFVALIGWGMIVEWVRLIGKLPYGTAAKLGLNLFGLGYIVAAVWGLLTIQSAMGALGALAVMALVWATDIGAYFSGRAIGGPKIAPSISPSKTWAGLVGGMVAAMLALWLFKRMEILTISDAAGNNFYVQVRTAMGAAVAVLAQAGDFFESWLKRRAGVKDSGRLIPGHGGLLDRLDGLLPVAILAGLLIGTQLP